jgi:hypothetical protein
VSTREVQVVAADHHFLLSSPGLLIAMFLAPIYSPAAIATDYSIISILFLDGRIFIPAAMPLTTAIISFVRVLD